MLGSSLKLLKLNSIKKSSTWFYPGEAAQFDMNLKKIMILEEFMLRVKYETFLECVQNHYQYYYKKLTQKTQIIPQNVIELEYLDINGQFDQLKFDKPEERQASEEEREAIQNRFISWSSYYL